MDVREAIAEFWRVHELGSGRVVVGFSGGPDSTALLHALAAMSKDLGLELIAAHLEHGMRGEEALRDVDHCAQFAARLGITFEVSHSSVPELARTQRLNIEEAGRRARYEFFEQVKLKHCAEYIATGHTLNDNAETVLMHLLRGSGLRGLRGIEPVRGSIIRPLLKVSRAATESYCREYGLATLTDVTNLDRTRERAWLREILAKRGSEEERTCLVISRLSEVVRGEDELLRELTKEKLAVLAKPEHPLVRLLNLERREYRLCREGFLRLHHALQRRILRDAFDELQPGHEAGFALVESIRSAALAGERAGFDVPRSRLHVVVSEEELKLTSTPRPEPFDIPLEPGVPVTVPLLGIGLFTVLLDGPPSREVPRECRALFDQESLVGGLRVRNYSPGRYRPAGAPGKKTIKDMLSESGVPSWLRPLAPVVYDAEGPVWALGCRVAARVAATRNTRKGILLTIRPRVPAV